MGKKILVVEDDFDTRYVLSLILRTEGYEVVTAADGECALAVAHGERPDLIITDINMPRLNGVELTRRLKLGQETSSIPVLAITAYGPMTMKNAISAGAIKTLASAGISGISTMLQAYREKSPLRRGVETAEVADAAVFLLGSAARGVTGEILMVDSGFHAMGGA